MRRASIDAEIMQVTQHDSVMERHKEQPLVSLHFYMTSMSNCSSLSSEIKTQKQQ
jgi:hypothetical protein